MSSSSRILKGPKIDPFIPKEPLGNLIFKYYKNRDPNDIAILNVDSGESYTYGQILEFSVNLASRLKEMGLKSEQIIGVVSENSPKVLVVALAGLFTGAPVHFINPKYTPYELEHVLNLSRPDFIFCWTNTLEKLLNLQETNDGLKHIKKIVLFDSDSKYPDYRNYEELVKDKRNFEIDKNFDPDEKTAFIFNSSGTTGLPKGVMITHSAFRVHFSHARNPEIFDARAKENVILILPFYHLFGFALLQIFTSVGAKILIMNKFAPAKFLKTVQDYKVEKLILVPGLIDCFSKMQIENDISSVREIITGGGHIPEEISQKIKEKFKIKGIRNAYGMSELSCTVTLTPKNVDKVASIGKVCPGRALKIIDTETSKPLGPGEVGHIMVVNHVMKGYVNDPERTLQAFDPEGFYFTGDLGYYDSEGYVYLLARIKDVIKYKGFQVSPTEIETVLMKKAGIADAAVIGKGDGRFGELPVAFVVLGDVQNGGMTEDDVKSHVAEFLNVEKQLHGGVKFVDKIPRDNFGKILRKELRELL